MLENSLTKGTVRTLIFKEGKTWSGVARECNIAQTADEPREAVVLLDEAVRGYIVSAKKTRLTANVLNQDPEPEYEKLWRTLESRKKIPSPIKVYSFGEQVLSSSK